MEIILCKLCEGRGSYLIWENTDRISSSCSKCNGSGRLLTKQYTIEIPFETKPELYIKADSDIIKIIQQLKSSIKS